MDRDRSNLFKRMCDDACKMTEFRPATAKGLGKALGCKADTFYKYYQGKRSVPGAIFNTVQMIIDGSMKLVEIPATRLPQRGPTERCFELHFACGG